MSAFPQKTSWASTIQTDQMAQKIHICTKMPNGRWDQNVKRRTSDSSFTSDIKVRWRSRRFGSPVSPHSPSLQSLSIGLGPRAPATKTLPKPPHQGGTKSFGFKRPFLVTVSAVFTTLEILFHIQRQGVLEGVSRLNRAQKFPAHTLSPLDNINKIAHFLSGSNRCYYFPPSLLMLPVEHGRTPEWRKSPGEKAFGVKIAVRHLKKVARISSLEFLCCWEVFGGKPKFIHDNKLPIRMNWGLAAAFLFPLLCYSTELTATWGIAAHRGVPTRKA